MLTKKSQYVYLTQNALESIAIAGRPYPLRNEKLVLLGEDEAWMREACFEREAMGGQTGAGIYNERILVTDTALAVSMHSRIKGLLDTGTFVDIAKIPSSILTVDFTTDNTNSDDDPLYDARNEYHSANTQASEARSAAMEIAAKKRDDELAAINSKYSGYYERFEEEKTVAKTLAANRKKDETDSENGRHDNEMTAIEAQYGAGAITLAEKIALEQKENDKHLMDIEAVDNKYVAALEKADADFNKNIAETLETIEKEKADAEKEYSDSAKAIDDTYAETLTGNRQTLCNAVRSALTNLSAGYFETWVYGYGYDNGMDERAGRWQKSIITKSCADEYLSREPRLMPSSTATNREFADLEHMTAKKTGYTVYRMAHIATYPQQVHYNPPQVARGDPLAWQERDGSVWTYSNLEFFIMAGGRYDTDTLKAIKCDAVQVRRENDHQSQEDARAAILDPAYENAVNTMSSVFPSEYQGDTVWEIGKYVVIRTVPEIPTRPNLRQELESAAESVNESLRSANERAEQIHDHNHVAFSWVPTTFTYRDCPNSHYYATIDEAADKRASDTAKAEETLEEKRQAAQQAYDDAAKTVIEKYDDGVKQLAKVRDGKKAAAYNNYITRTINASVSANSQIAATDDEGRKEKILSDFLDNTAAQLREEYDNSCQKADEEYLEGLEPLATQRDAALAPLAAKRDDAIAEAVEEYNDAIEDIEETYQSVYDAQVEDVENRRRAAEALTDEQAKWEALSGIFPIDLNNRNRYVATISPVGTVKYGDESGVWFERLENTTAVFEPRTLTGVDFSAYYGELENQQDG